MNGPAKIENRFNYEPKTVLKAHRGRTDPSTYKMLVTEEQYKDVTKYGVFREDQKQEEGFSKELISTDFYKYKDSTAKLGFPKTFHLTNENMTYILIIVSSRNSIRIEMNICR